MRLASRVSRRPSRSSRSSTYVLLPASTPDASPRPAPDTDPHARREHLGMQTQTQPCLTPTIDPRTRIRRRSHRAPVHSKLPNDRLPLRSSYSLVSAPHPFRRVPPRPQHAFTDDLYVSPAPVPARPIAPEA
ncbi:hypothetical protein C8R45DRAFT_1109209 [Mycena sanguinolenta]|nr:hypothetical protein C8R45DRAFT_1109209 [Mycena sanguinolenta]